MNVDLKTNSIEDYRKFLAIKALPRFSFTGRTAAFPDEYASVVGEKKTSKRSTRYKPISAAFDYQAGITKLAITKKKFAAFMACGMGKTLVMSEYVRHVRQHIPKSKSILIVSPSMVIPQTMGEFQRFYSDEMPIERIRANALGKWLTDGRGIGITNYEAITDELPDQPNIAALILDESSLLKSHYGKWGTRLIQMGKGLEWKLCLTGTPAPNDRIEYANHAVFLDQFPTVNAFLARFFVNRGQTDNRWELKPHALKPFYRALSHWCIFLSNPAVYGWKDNTEELPPINVHIHDVELTEEQHDAARSESKALFATAGGITSRAKLAQIAKGKHNGKDIESLKPAFIKNLVQSFGKESSIIWCRYNSEQDGINAVIEGAANIDGSTPEDDRIQMIGDFQKRKRQTLISKPKILGFGLNLQVCSRMIFSTLQDSYEEYHQALKRANRYGSKLPLNVHIPLTDIERPMVDTVLRKARMVDEDTKQQEIIFREFINDV